jgi:hypothetical protein
MKTTIKVAFSENSKAVLAETKLEVEVGDNENMTSEEISRVQQSAKDIFSNAQEYALLMTMRRQ